MNAGNVTLESGDFGWDYLLVHDDGRNRYVQTDRDYPGIAENLGWTPCKVQAHCHVTEHGHTCDDPDVDGCPDPDGCPGFCEHRGTDGTVACMCGASAMQFIASAQRWLDEHTGENFDDPGYFDSED